MNPSVETNVWGEISPFIERPSKPADFGKMVWSDEFERLDSTGQVIHLRAPNEVIKNWVVSNYSKLLDESLNDLRLNGYSLGWEIGKPEISQLPSTSMPGQTVSETHASAPAVAHVSN
jgi:chromosomal replication initiation ATPase DnaA